MSFAFFVYIVLSSLWNTHTRSSRSWPSFQAPSSSFERGQNRKQSGCNSQSQACSCSPAIASPAPPCHAQPYHHQHCAADHASSRLAHILSSPLSAKTLPPTPPRNGGAPSHHLCA